MLRLSCRDEAIKTKRVEGKASVISFDCSFLNEYISSFRIFDTI